MSSHIQRTRLSLKERRSETILCEKWGEREQVAQVNLRVNMRVRLSNEGLDRICISQGKRDPVCGGRGRRQVVSVRISGIRAHFQVRRQSGVL